MQAAELLVHRACRVGGINVTVGGQPLQGKLRLTLPQLEGQLQEAPEDEQSKEHPGILHIPNLSESSCWTRACRLFPGTGSTCSLVALALITIWHNCTRRSGRRKRQEFQVSAPAGEAAHAAWGVHPVRIRGGSACSICGHT